MDVNGTRFHLIKGTGDWREVLSETTRQGFEANLSWSQESEWLTLSAPLSRFPINPQMTARSPEARRGAAADRFGNWYWIAHDRQRIFWQPSGSKRPSVYWQQNPSPATVRAGEFGPSAPTAPTITTLSGLAVTEHHYLVVGNASLPGLFRFDLHAGGEPLQLLFPRDIPFEPFDMAPAPGGGLWILDRRNRRYWGLDRDFRVLSAPQATTSPQTPTSMSPFHPFGQPQAGAVAPHHEPPRGFPTEAQSPLSIVGLADGSVLILDEAPGPEAAAVSTLYHEHFGTQMAPPLPLRLQVEVIGPDGEATTAELPIAGHDMTLSDDGKRLYVVDRGGAQVFALAGGQESPGSPFTVSSVIRDYLPLHYFGSRALVMYEGQPYYDVVGGEASRDPNVRWVRLQVIDQPRFDRSATIVTPVFDGKTRDCNWDRLCLDACIPPETSVEVWTRVQNDRDLLAGAPFEREPELYLRGQGSEVPYYEPFPDLRSKPPSRETGTWELLFQRARGQFLQIRLELSGNGRATPQLRALRAYYPRFSISRRYLPAVYQEDAESAAFLERLLANPQGILTHIEGKMTDVSLLFDARSAPAETLDWLAGWVGLMLDPLWERIQQQRQQRDRMPAIPAPDRRRLFIRYAMRLYEQRGTPDGVRFALHLLLDPCLEITLQRFKDASVKPSPRLQSELQQLGLPYPTPVSTEEQFEDLLYQYVLAPGRPSKVRIVERFLTRGGRALVSGDPSAEGQASVEQTIETTAHRFSVLVPENLSPEEAAMVERVVELEKPAHTLFDVRRYWDYFRVGEARLEIDTILGEEGRFAPMILGRDYLAEGYLPAAHPMDVTERLILDRDGISTPPL